MDKPKPPARLRASGRRLWVSVTDGWELDPDELAALEAACRTADEITVLEKALGDAEPVVTGSKGQPVAHPLFAELRGHRETLRKLLAELRVPAKSAGNATAGSDWGRHMAERRWKGKRGA